MTRLAEIRHRTDKPHLALREYGDGRCHIEVTNKPALEALGQDSVAILNRLNPQLLGAWSRPTISQAVQSWYFGDRPRYRINWSLTTCL